MIKNTDTNRQEALAIENDAAENDECFVATDLRILEHHIGMLEQKLIKKGFSIRHLETLIENLSSRLDVLEFDVDEIDMVTGDLHQTVYDLEQKLQ